MNVYESIIYTKFNDNEAQLGGYTDEDQNALDQTACPNTLTIQQYADIDSKQYIVTRVAKRSFRGCTSLTTVYFPDTISVIEDYSFDQTSIKDLKLPKDLTSIGIWSFGTNYIETIEFPENLQYIADCAFSPTKKLQRFNVPKDHKYLSSDSQGALYNKDQTILYTVPELVTNFQIPETVKKINGGAFQHSNIGTIIVPQKCTYIGFYALSYAKAEEIIFLGNILFMDYQVIDANQPLKKITYHGSLPVSPDSNVFANSINSINIQIDVCNGYKGEKFSSFRVNKLNTCPAVIFYTKCSICGRCNFQLYDLFKILVSHFLIIDKTK